jgi:hypothetical protein
MINTWNSIKSACILFQSEHRYGHEAVAKFGNDVSPWSRVTTKFGSLHPTTECFPHKMPYLYRPATR